LKDHADPLPERDDIRTRLIDVLTIECDSPFDTSMRDKFVQAVESSEKSRFSTSGGSDQGGDLALSDQNVDIFEGMG
jgi:hypothetical protein